MMETRQQRGRGLGCGALAEAGSFVSDQGVQKGGPSEDEGSQEGPQESVLGTNKYRPWEGNEFDVL